MSEEYRGKVFKSGNSVALRLPKGLGIAEGTEVRMVKDVQTGFRVEPVEGTKAKLDVSRFWGKAKGMIHVPEPREDFDPRPSSLLRSKP